MTVYLLNSAVLTDFGEYIYTSITVDEAREILKGGFVSAIGHKGIAEFLTKLFGLQVPMNRVEIKMQPGDVAIVYKIAQRLPPGPELSAEDLEKVPFVLGMLKRVK